MKTIHAIYENGIFRPRDLVKLPEHCEVEFEPKIVSGKPDRAKAQKKIREILSRRFETDDPFLAANHNEHQP